MPRLILPLALSFAVCTLASAQVAHPAGVTRQMNHVSDAAPRTLDRPRPPIQMTDEGPGIGRYAGLGFLAGAVVGGVVGAVVVSQSDDAFFPGLAIITNSVVGALGGAVVGVVVYIVTHLPDDH
jgi:hypothetical protein